MLIQRPLPASYQLLLLTFLPLLLGCASSKEYRFFKHVGGTRHVLDIANAASGLGGYAYLVELDESHRVISDTMRVWVQHYKPDEHIWREAYQADMVIACHPRDLPKVIRERHVLPSARDVVVVYKLGHQTIVVTAGKDPKYEFMVRSLIDATASGPVE